MWTILGYPPVGIAVPLQVANGANQPEGVMKQEGSDNCRLCDEALARRAEIFPLKRGNGKNYFNVRKAQEYMRELAPIEEANFRRFQ